MHFLNWGMATATSAICIWFMTTKAAKAKQPTAQERYDAAVDKQFEDWLERSHSREALKGVPLYEHKVPSGIVFKVRNLSEEFLTESGAMQMGELPDEVQNTEPIETLTPEEKKQRAIEAFEKLSPAERRAQAVMVSRQIRYICVSPRILMTPVNGHGDALQLSKLSALDFGSLNERSNPMRGEASFGLRTFHKKR